MGEAEKKYVMKYLKFCGEIAWNSKDPSNGIYAYCSIFTIWVGYNIDANCPERNGNFTSKLKIIESKCKWDYYSSNISFLNLCWAPIEDEKFSRKNASCNSHPIAFGAWGCRRDFSQQRIFLVKYPWGGPFFCYFFCFLQTIFWHLRKKKDAPNESRKRWLSFSVKCWDSPCVAFKTKSGEVNF